MNSVFADYTTSGAFALTLTRNQVAAVAMLAGSGEPYYLPHASALHRKGLAEIVPAPTRENSEAVEVRATHAGLLVARLLQEAGLTNRADDPIAVELEALRRELVERRREAAEARQVARSALARRDELELEIEQERAFNTGAKLPIRILRRDPLPDLDLVALRRLAEDPRP